VILRILTQKSLDSKLRLKRYEKNEVMGAKFGFGIL
jgi:hypothetical protein